MKHMANRQLSSAPVIQHGMMSCLRITLQEGGVGWGWGRIDKLKWAYMHPMVQRELWVVLCLTSQCWLSGWNLLLLSAEQVKSGGALRLLFKHLHKCRPTLLCVVFFMYVWAHNK